MEFYASSYPVRPLKQSVDEFGRFSYEPGVLENLMVKNAAELFGVPIQILIKYKHHRLNTEWKTKNGFNKTF